MITLKQIQALDAVVNEGSFQRAATVLCRTHPSVISQLHKLEAQLGFELFDRSGYRTVLTAAGAAFYHRSRRLLGDHDELLDLARHLQAGKETQLRIVIGDVTPLQATLRLLRGFAEQHRHVQLDLSFENLSGPRERLLDGDADLIIHYIDPADPRYEYQPLASVNIIPVAAPGFLGFKHDTDLRYEDLRDHTQCIIRDTARHTQPDSYFVLEDAPRLTVGDQHTKKAVIREGMAWGHMPEFLISSELESGALVSIAGNHVKGSRIEIVAARLDAGEKGVMAEMLWQYFVETQNFASPQDIAPLRRPGEDDG